MIPAVRSWTRDEMMKRVAFFKDLKGSKTGLPDSDLPECERELIPTSTKWQPVQAQTATVSGLWQARIVRLTAAGLST